MNRILHNVFQAATCVISSNWTTAEPQALASKHTRVIEPLPPGGTWIW